MRDETGAVLHEEHRSASVFDWIGQVAPGVPIGDVHTVELRTAYTPEATGRHRIAAVGAGRTVMRVGRQQVDGDAHEARRAGPDIDFAPPPASVLELDLVAGEEVPIEISRELEPHAGRVGAAAGALFGLAVRGFPDDDATIAEAVALAASSDLAVVVVGTSPEVESEGFDRSGLGLPGRQNELVEAVVAANPRTVVVVNSGGPVLLPWRDRVPALLTTWFPGQEAGHALADVLTGVAEPGGRLPMSWPGTEQTRTVVQPVDGRLAYSEGLLVGHRSSDVASAAAFPFAHGLGYTTWRIDSASEIARDGGNRTIDVRITNTGDRDGSEVVLVWAGVDGGADLPVRWLVGFARARARAGEQRSVILTVSRRSLQQWRDEGWFDLPDVQLQIALAAGDLHDVTSGVADERQ